MIDNSKWLGDSIKFFGDSGPPSSQESTEQTIGALTSRLPQLMEALNKEILPNSKANLEAQQATSSDYDKLITELYAKYAPDLARTGAKIDDISRSAGATTSANILANQGKDIGAATTSIDRAANPEYYATREAASKKLGELLGSINLNDANPEAERLVGQENARTGQSGNVNATNTTANALAFGNEKAKRTATLSSAINSATQFLQPSNNTAAVNAATGAAGTPAANTGVSTFAGANKIGDTASSTANGLLSQVAGFQNNAAQINSQRRDVLDRVNGTLSSL